VDIVWVRVVRKVKNLLEKSSIGGPRRAYWLVRKTARID
jgi:hypothetical protein